SNGDGTFELNQPRTHSKANEILTVAGSSSYVSSDKNGNMMKVPKPDNWSAAYDLVYDAWNRLVTVKSGSTVVASYAYDGTNRRIKKIVGSETRLFYFNRQWQCLEEYVGSTCDIRYVWGLRYIDDLVTYRKGSTDYYVLQDVNWNVVGLTNVSGAIQERYSYSSFGKLNVFDASFTPKPASSLGMTRIFTGQVLDNETGLMLYRNRVYHPTLGRFIQRYPIGYDAGDVNIYRYVRNRSILYTDTWGWQTDNWPRKRPGGPFIKPRHYFPWEPYCLSLKQTILNHEQEVKERWDEYIEDKKGLPEREFGDELCPGLSRWGHREKYEEHRKLLEDLINKYKLICDRQGPSPEPIPEIVYRPLPNYEPYPEKINPYDIIPPLGDKVAPNPWDIPIVPFVPPTTTPIPKIPWLRFPKPAFPTGPILIIPLPLIPGWNDDPLGGPGVA
ncbi:MAG: RHS repeat-associated core domain-containing protein, partial [Planctomycetaceae bacterium]|nr:RHS repeat-associated core domain-containing protein [Planctomycetaceae bacterium]